MALKYLSVRGWMSAGFTLVLAACVISATLDLATAAKDKFSAANTALPKAKQ